MLWKRLKFSRRCGVALAMTVLGLLQASFVSAAPAPPPNDTCAGAEVIPGNGPFPRYSSVTADITGATNTFGDPPHPTDCYPGNDIFSSIWYQFTPATGGVYVLSVNDTA